MSKASKKTVTVTIEVTEEEIRDFEIYAKRKSWDSVYFTVSGVDPDESREAAYRVCAVFEKVVKAMRR